MLPGAVCVKNRCPGHFRDQFFTSFYTRLYKIRSGMGPAGLKLNEEGDIQNTTNLMWKIKDQPRNSTILLALMISSNGLAPSGCSELVAPNFDSCQFFHSWELSNKPPCHIYLWWHNGGRDYGAYLNTTSLADKGSVPANSNPEDDRI